MPHLNPSVMRLLLIGMVVIGLSASMADAGSVLLARESSIRASGKAGSGNFDLSDGSKDFNGFADTVDSVDAGVAGPRLSANQHSRPATSLLGGFTGAFAEGSASAQGAAADDEQAVSNFNLTFEILGSPTLARFGGSVGVSGDGLTKVSLANETTGEMLLSQEIFAGDDEGQQIQHSTVLQPGIYGLSVNASVNGDLDDSMAYYTVSLSLSALAANEAPPSAIPLPPALWSAISVFGAGGALRAFRNRRKR